MRTERTRTCFTSALTCAAALFSLPACGDVDDALPAAASDDAVDLRVLASDPSSAASFGWCPHNQSFDGVPTVIRYPTATNCNAIVDDSPLVLLLHGATYPYDSYDYLLEHLASNGFIAVSVDILADDPGGHEDAAALAKGVLDDLLATWPKASAVDPSRLGLVGHSRGGQTARYLADLLKGGGDAWTVRAVVGLASKGGDDMVLGGDKTTGMMVIQGTADTDQTADRAFENYDFAGSEGSVPFAQAGAFYKSMKLLQGGNHSHFSERDAIASTQALVTQGYVLAFLAAHLRGDATWYEDYIRGDAVPHGWPNTVVSQVSDGFWRMAIDHFEDGTLGSSTIGGTVTASLGVSAAVVDLGAASGAQHETHALRLSGAVTGAGVTWSVPDIDASDFEWLSLRIGQTSGAPSQSLKVQLRNDGDWSDPVAITDHGAIPTPMAMCPPPPYSCPPPLPFEHMGTVRVPLSAFGPHDDVEAVRFVLTGKMVGQEFLLDNIEFAEWLLKP